MRSHGEQSCGFFADTLSSSLLADLSFANISSARCHSRCLNGSPKDIARVYFGIFVWFAFFCMPGSKEDC